MFLSVITKNLNWEILHFMWIISSHQAEFSYLAFFELVWLTLAHLTSNLTNTFNFKHLHDTFIYEKQLGT